MHVFICKKKKKWYREILVEHKFIDNWMLMQTYVFVCCPFFNVTWKQHCSRTQRRSINSPRSHCTYFMMEFETTTSRGVSNMFRHVGSSLNLRKVEHFSAKERRFATIKLLRAIKLDFTLNAEWVALCKIASSSKNDVTTAN